MKNKEKDPAPGSNVLNHAPPGEQRSRNISRFYPSLKGLSKELVVGKCPVPPETGDIGEWILSLARSAGFRDWKEAAGSIPMPGEKMLLFPVPHDNIPDDLPAGDSRNLSQELLARALVLARCNKNAFLPDGPFIFTRSRLERSIRLIQINTRNFYELE